MRTAAALLAALALLAPVAAAGPAPAHPAAAVAERPPAPPPADIAPLVGEYGAGEALVVVYEKEGALYADGGGLDRARLTRAGAGWTAGGRTLKFEPGQGGRPASLTGLGAARPRTDRGAEVEATIRAAVRADPERLRTRALAATPPAESGKRPSDLVDLTTVDPRVRLDIRYAGTNNFMGVKLYERPGAYMQRPAAEALGRAQKALAAKGYGLMIHDAYRPWFVTWMFWEATPAAFHNFVANPANGSRHNRGCAVDLTLYDLKTGKVIEMPGRYDEFSARSKRDYVGGTSRQRWHRDVLRREMERQGFEVHPDEWWHFDYKDWREYPIGNRTFTDLAGAR